MMKNILITGGPVSTRVDAVKIITNRFKGGLMQKLADELDELDGVHVTYLAEKDAPPLDTDYQCPGCRDYTGVSFLYHDGLEDYRNQVLQLAPKMDAVILGAAVANIAPQHPWEDKFPSHNYGPDDVIPINFVLTPRIITEVKEVAPKTHLFGFKFLANAEHDELISAAYGIVLDSRCTAVFANDRSDLKQVSAVTKERAIHPMPRTDMAAWIFELLQDEYYSTKHEKFQGVPSEIHQLEKLIERYQVAFIQVETGLIFGTVAVRLAKGGFVTTGRGKKELSDTTVVTQVDHDSRTVHVSGDVKATLNAPLLDIIFNSPKVHSIVHFHDQQGGIPTRDYAPPGTVRDSRRFKWVRDTTSFNIEHHGCFLLFDKEENLL